MAAAQSRRSTRRAARRASRQEAGVIHRLVLLVMTCGLAGLVLVGLLLPLVGGAGLAVRAGADTFQELPQDLLEPPLAQRSVLMDKTGAQLAVLHGAEDRVPITIEAVPTVMKRAIVAIEDNRFYEHHGVDYQGVTRAFVRNSQNGSRQGGSTITQQYVKNVLKESAQTKEDRDAAEAPTFRRKLREARYALELERRLSKDQILERYLNITYFGEGVYGVGLAAQHYFNKTRVGQLNLAQAALLAGIVNAPERFDPFDNPTESKTRRDLVLDRMLELGLATQTEHDKAVQAPLPSKPPPPPPSDPCEGVTVAGPGGTRVEAGFFCDYARRTLLSDTHFGDTQAEIDRGVYDGGLRVRTTLDPAVQAAAQAAVDAAMPRSDPIAAIVAVVEPGTGKVLAIAANRTYSDAKKTGFTRIRLADERIFHGGSTWKAFTLTAAIKQGVPLKTKIKAPPCYFPDPLRFDTPGDVGRCPKGFQNAESAEGGDFDLRTGTWFSVNTFYIQLEERVGVQAVIDTASDMGIGRQAFIDPGSGQPVGARSLSITLGAAPGNVSALEMATAYATLAAHGVQCDPRALSTVTDAAGKPVPTNKARDCRRVLEVGVADTVTSILAGVLTQKGATAQGKGLPGRPAAGKTGTGDNSAVAWFVGYTPQLSTAVVLGNTAASSQPLGVVQGVSPVYGGTIPAAIWQNAMTAASAGKEVLPLGAADPAIAAGQAGTIPDVQGLLPQQAGEALIAAGYGWRWGGRTEPATVTAGTVARTIPDIGSPAPPGTEVQLVTGSGVAPPVFVPPPVVPPPPAPAATASAPPSPSAAPTSASAAAASPPPKGGGRPSGRPRRP